MYILYNMILLRATRISKKNEQNTNMARENVQRKRIAINPPRTVERWIAREQQVNTTSKNLVCVAGIVALRSLPEKERRWAYQLARPLDTGLLSWERFCEVQKLRADAVQKVLETLEEAVLQGIPAEELELPLPQNGKRKRK